MKYKKIEKENYNLHMVKTDKFKTVYFKLTLKEKLNKKHITYRNMLVNILPTATKKFHSRRLMEIESENLYNVGYSMGTCGSGIYNIMELRGSFLSDIYTEKGMNEKSLKFIFDILLNPNIKNGEFDNKAYEISYNRLLNDINLFKDNPKKYASLRLHGLMDKKLSLNMYGYKEDLESMTSKKLYSYYKKMLKTNKIDIFIVGNIDFDEIQSLIEKTFKINNSCEFNDPHYIEFDKFRSRTKTVVEPSKFNQSTLIIGFKINGTSAFERQYVSSVFSFIFGGSPDSKLFKTVREKHSLCYSVYASIASVSNVMTVFAGIDASNFKKAVKLIKEEFKNMCEGNFDEDAIEKAKITYKNSLKELEDNPGAIINMYATKEYVDFDLISERFDKIDTVTKMDIINYAKKIHIDTVYLLEGGNNDEENAS